MEENEKKLPSIENELLFMFNHNILKTNLTLKIGILILCQSIAIFVKLETKPNFIWKSTVIKGKL